MLIASFFFMAFTRVSGAASASAASAAAASATTATATAASIAAGSTAPTWLLWMGTMGLALGFASSIPCSYTVPAEAGVPSTPSRVLSLNLGGSAGEMLLPLLLGMAFQRGAFASFGLFLMGLQLVVLCAIGLTWSVVRRTPV